MFFCPIFLADLILVEVTLDVFTVFLVRLVLQRLFFFPFLFLFLGFMIFNQLLNVFGRQLLVRCIALLGDPWIDQRLRDFNLFVVWLARRLGCLVLALSWHLKLFTVISIDHCLLLWTLHVIEALELGLRVFPGFSLRLFRVIEAFLDFL